MTRYKFFKKNGFYFGFTETGHAGYADAGNDIVCSALSAMTMLVINAIEVTYASDVIYNIDEEKVRTSRTKENSLPYRVCSRLFSSSLTTCSRIITNSST